VLVLASDRQATAGTLGHLRGVLKDFANEMFTTNGWTLNAANEIEGFLVRGIDAERVFHETGSFEYVNKGGYYHSLPGESACASLSTPLRKCSGDGL